MPDTAISCDSREGGMMSRTGRCGRERRDRIPSTFGTAAPCEWNQPDRGSIGAFPRGAPAPDFGGRLPPDPEFDGRDASAIGRQALAPRDDAVDPRRADRERRRERARRDGWGERAD